MTLLDDLKAQQEKISAALANTTDEKTFDSLTSEQASITKSITLTENRERARAWKEESDRHAAALKKYNSDLKKIEKAKQDAEVLDLSLFEKLHDVYTAYDNAYDLRLAIVEKTKEMIITAQELGLEPPAKELLFVCGMLSNNSKQDQLNELVSQYDLCARQIKAAKRRGEKCPDKPGFTWFMKGDGRNWNTPETTPDPQDVEKG